MFVFCIKYGCKYHNGILVHYLSTELELSNLESEEDFDEDYVPDESDLEVDESDLEEAVQNEEDEVVQVEKAIQVEEKEDLEEEKAVQVEEEETVEFDGNLQSFAKENLQPIFDISVHRFLISEELVQIFLAADQFPMINETSLPLTTGLFYINSSPELTRSCSLPTYSRRNVRNDYSITRSVSVGIPKDENPPTEP